MEEIHLFSGDELHVGQILFSLPLGQPYLIVEV